MAKILLRRRRDPAGWQVELPARLSPTGKRQVRSFSGPEAEADARAWRGELEHGIRLKKAGVNDQISVSDAVWSWLSGPYGKALKPSTLRTNESAYVRHIQPAFGGLRISDLTEERILEFVNQKLDAGLSPHSVRTIVNVVARAVRVACRRDGNPLPDFGNVGELLSAAARAREIEVKETEWWTEAEVEKILRAASTCEPTFRAFVRVAADTGMRRGEIMGLQLHDINFTDSLIHVRRAIVEGKATTPKGGKSRRVEMGQGLTLKLQCYLEPLRFDASTPLWIFQFHGFRPHWNRLRKRFAAQGVRPLKFHCFRHSWATHAIANGEPIPWVSAQLGHASAAFTLKQYAHAQPRREGRLGWLENREKAL